MNDFQAWITPGLSITVKDKKIIITQDIDDRIEMPLTDFHIIYLKLKQNGQL